MPIAKEIVRKWHEALNRGDVDNMQALVHQDVVIGGPQGITSGAQIMREWYGRANVRLYPLKYFANGQTIIVEEKGEWIDAGNGQVLGSQIVATVFAVEDGLITRIVRHDQVEVAPPEGEIAASDRA